MYINVLFIIIQQSSVAFGTPIKIVQLEHQNQDGNRIDIAIRRAN
jgi:hypothetical protein